MVQKLDAIKIYEIAESGNITKAFCPFRHGGLVFRVIPDLSSYPNQVFHYQWGYFDPPQ